MKITLSIEDVQKIIGEAYIGVNDITCSVKQIEFYLDVDDDTFQKKKSLKESLQTIPNKVISVNSVNGKISTKDLLPEIDGKSKVDYNTLLAIKEADRIEMTDEQIAKETHIPLVKSIEEKNKEARAKGLMTSGRNTERIFKKF